MLIVRQLVASCTPAAGSSASGPSRRTKELGSLTERELEVLLELARGFTNAEIAGRLHFSETTVKTHVAHVLGKLGSGIGFRL